MYVFYTLTKIPPTTAQTDFSLKNPISLTITVYYVYEHDKLHLAMAGFFNLIKKLPCSFD